MRSSVVPFIKTGFTGYRALYDGASRHPTPREQRLALLCKQLYPVCIAAKCKGPTDAGWSDPANVTRSWLEERRDLPNTGILCGVAPHYIVAVDIDVFDRGAVCRVIDIADDTLGTTPCIRLGRKGALLTYRSAGPRRKRTHNLRRDALASEPTVRPAMGVEPEKDHTPKIEILGTGQQFVSFGTHPAGMEYTWSGHWLTEAEYESRSPLDIDPAHLPLIDDAKLAAFIAALVDAGLIEPPGQDRHDEKSAAGEVRQSDPWKLATGLDVLRYVLPNVEPWRGRDGWRNAGMALRAAVIRHDDGRELDDGEKLDVWVEWSTGALGSHSAPGQQLDMAGVQVAGESELETQWHSFATVERSGHFTMASLFDAAHKLGYSGSPDGRIGREVFSGLIDAAPSPSAKDSPSSDGEPLRPADNEPTWHVYTDEPDLPQREYIIEGLIPADPCVGGIAAFQHVGKTATGASMAAAIVTDQPAWGGCRITPGCYVVFVSTEGTGAAVEQFHGALKALGSSWSKVKDRFVMLNVEEGIDLNVEGHRGKLISLIQKHVPAGARFVVFLDTFIDGTGSADDMDHAAMKATMAHLYRLAVHIGAPTCASFHVGLNRRDEPSVPLGAPVIAAKCAFLLGVAQTNWNDRASDRVLTVHKMRGRAAEPITLHLTPGSGTTGRGKRFSATVFTPSTPTGQARSETLKPAAVIARIIRDNPAGPKGDGKWAPGALIKEHGKALAEAFGLQGRNGKLPQRTALYAALKRFSDQVGERGVNVPVTGGEITMPMLIVCREKSGSRDDVWFELRGCPAVDAALEAGKASDGARVRGAAHVARVRTMFLDFKEWDFSSYGEHVPFKQAAEKIGRALSDSYEAVAGALDRLLGIKGTGDAECLGHVVPTDGDNKRTRRTTFIKQNVAAQMPALAQALGLSGAQNTGGAS